MANDEHFEAILSVKERVEDGLLQIPGVHGVSLGYKVQGGEPTDQLAITIHLTRKLPLDQVPEAERIPAEIEGVPTDVIAHPQSEAFPAMTDSPSSTHKGCDTNIDSAKYRPLEGGCQIEPVGKNWYGTLGCFVRRNTTTYFLTNEHVLPHEAHEVRQPTIDKYNEIGNQYLSLLTPYVDAAIGTVTTSWSNRIIDVGTISGSYEVTADDIVPPGYSVRKRGRTTRLCTGRITRINYSGTRGDGWHFKDQLFVDRAIGKGGDSGSALVDDGRSVVGLYWGGSGQHGVASMIGHVMATLNVYVPSQADSSSELAAQAGSSPVTDLAELARRVTRSLERAGEGAIAQRFFDLTLPGICDLIQQNRRMKLVWHENEGDLLVSSALNLLQQGNEPLPERLGEVATRDAIDNILAAAESHADSELAEAIDEIRPFADAFLAAGWKEVAGSRTVDPA